MRFHLLYEGPLKSNGTPLQKMEIRRQLHPQLRKLWEQRPLNTLVDRGCLNPPNESTDSILRYVGDFAFAPLVTGYLDLIAELTILILRPQEPGDILSHAGDLDNRIKTLLDALRTPDNPNELGGLDPKKDEDLFFCLLEDDAFVVGLDVQTGRYLREADPSEVVALITVIVRPTIATFANIGLGTV